MQNPEFKLHPSRFYCLFLAAMLLASAVIILVLPFAAWLRALLAAALMVYGVSIFRRFALLRAPFSVTGLKKHEEKRWQVMTCSGEFAAILRGDSTVTTLVSVLRFDLDGEKRQLSSIICRDSLSADDYRRLVGVIRMG